MTRVLFDANIKKLPHFLNKKWTRFLGGVTKVLAAKIKGIQITKVS